MRKVAIWRSALISASETFIRNQADSLGRWEPVYVGATKTASTLARDTDITLFRAQRDHDFLRLRLLGSSPVLRRALTDLRPDLVHAHFGGDGWLVSGEAARAGIPLLVTLHGHDVTRQPESTGAKGVRYRRNLRTVFARAAGLIAVSEVIRQRAIGWGADPAKVRVHHTGVPIPAAVPTGPKRWDVAFVGRFVEKKGADDLLAALATLDAPKAVFIGDGPRLEEMREYARSLRVDATFLGAQPAAEVYRLLGESRVVAAPSRTAADGDSEGLPTTVVEAMALGLPVVSTRHSGIPEAVADGTTGLLGAEGDREALAANLRKLLGDQDLQTAYGTAARARAEAEFDVVKQSRRLEDVYDSVAGQRS
ncbi:glucosyltransferase [Paractinoplanes abujensis]|uniref:Glycosyltransferase involved in cell wall biosynthesis n=1 Tax=Paractinoplanes abujensis TaxID=882441 RepID=A0A7W7G0G5_9ACTN|nr:glycosyltransferase [Actinoplanes abujensis]MBB4691597.1 glycosyltransferase involved in cell wall biosynthesis [Actinoplanes abujensis]GID16984.1 glucosyltransferase [Actinoplanes abujensis]